MKSPVLFLFAATIALPSIALSSVLPKDISEIKSTFDKEGATSCSQSMAETLHFIAKGRAITVNKQWATSNTNKKPISVDFLVSGTKSDYSMNGAVVLTPVENQCIGSYVYNFVAPSENCKTYMQKEGFDGPEWTIDITDPNGDGGSVYFISLKSNAGLSFVLNDVAGGCNFRKRETLFLNRKS